MPDPVSTAQRSARVLHVTRNLPPLVGGMEKLNYQLALGLIEFLDAHVVGPEASAELFVSDRFTGVKLRPLWRFLSGALLAARRQARQRGPDVVIGGSGLMAPIVLVAARACGSKSVLYVHGLDLTVPHWLYQKVWGAAIRRVDCIIANSGPTAVLAKQMGIPGNRVRVVCPGVEIAAPVLDPQNYQAFLDRYYLRERKVLLSVGRLTARKGLKQFVEKSLPAIVGREPATLLLVIGDAPSDALHADPQSPDEIMQVAKAAGVSENIRFLGRTDDETLNHAYQVAQVHIFPLREVAGDPEGFGMVALEAAVKGVPTVAFACGGVVDAVSDGASGYLVSPGDYASLARKTVVILEGGVDLSESAKSFATGFAWPRFNQQIRACLAELIGER